MPEMPDRIPITYKWLRTQLPPGENFSLKGGGTPLLKRLKNLFDELPPSNVHVATETPTTAEDANMTPRARKATYLGCQKWINSKMMNPDQKIAAAARICDRSFQPRVDITCKRLATRGFGDLEGLLRVTDAEWSRMKLPLSLHPIVKDTALSTAQSPAARVTTLG